MKTLKENYTSVCQRCGLIFKNNRSTGKFCSNAHRSLYGQDGPMINDLVPDHQGVYFHADKPLGAAYAMSVKQDRIGSGGWSCSLSDDELADTFSYNGPLPNGNILLVVGSFLLNRIYVDSKQESEILYQLKPITLLTKTEKVVGVLISFAELHREELEGGVEKDNVPTSEL